MDVTLKIGKQPPKKTPEDTAVKIHLLAGRIGGAAYVASFCTCGLAFLGFIKEGTGHPDWEKYHSEACAEADRKLGEHWTELRER